MLNFIIYFYILNISADTSFGWCFQSNLEPYSLFRTEPLIKSVGIDARHNAEFRILIFKVSNSFYFGISGAKK